MSGVYAFLAVQGFGGGGGVAGAPFKDGYSNFPWPVGTGCRLGPVAVSGSEQPDSFKGMTQQGPLIRD